MGHSYAREGLAGVEVLDERGSSARCEASLAVERDGPSQAVHDARAHILRVVLEVALHAGEALRDPALHAMAACVKGVGEVREEQLALRGLEVSGVESRGLVVFRHGCTSVGTLCASQTRDASGSDEQRRSMVQSRGHTRRTRTPSAHPYHLNSQRAPERTLTVSNIL